MRVFKSRKLLVALLSLVFIFMVSAFGLSFINKKAGAFSGGDGLSETTAYEISTAEQLAYLAEQVNSGINYSDTYFKLTADIDLINYGANYNNGHSGCGWVPIGTFIDEGTLPQYNPRPFKGHFDGNNHIINNLYINNQNYFYDYMGLFGYISSGAEVKNIVVTNGSLVGNQYVGGMVGYNENSSILNCSFSGSVKGNLDIGGITGFNSGVVENCYNVGDIIGIGINSTLGGIAGNNQGEIYACFNTGNVSGNNNIGGIAGLNSGSISECFNAGIISGADVVGGIAGGDSISGSSSNISSCYNTGSISGINSVGGIAGSISSTKGVWIDNCYNAGLVTGNNSMGGLVGSASVYTHGTNFYNSDYNIVGVGGSPDYGFGLTTERMINQDVLILPSGTDAGGMSELLLTGEWVKRTNLNQYSYYPELKVFAGESAISGIAPDASTDIQIASRESVKVINWNEQDSYEIYLASQMKSFADEASVKNFAGITINLMADISLAVYGENYNSGAGWEPIIGEFNGTFNGNNHVISNLYINRPLKDEIGLFSKLGSQGVIINLGVEGFVIGREYVGGIVGYNKGRITDCYNTSYVGGNNSVGGIVGATFGGEAGSDNNVIKNCYNTGLIEGIGSTGTLQYIGGIAGSTNNYALVENCFNSGIIRGGSLNSAGGIAGRNSSMAVVLNCYNTGYVGGNNNVGGIAGTNFGSVKNCYNAGLITGTFNTGAITGNSGSIADCFYDYERSGAEGNGINLTTGQMTQDNVLTVSYQDFYGMKELQDGGEAWCKPQYNDGNLYYPELKAFAESTNERIKAASKESVKVDSRPSANVSVAIDGWTYLDAPNHYYFTKFTYDGDMDSAVVEYKVKGANDNTYTTSIPFNAGHYTLRVTLPETETYRESLATCDFEISKAQAVAPGTLPSGFTANIGDKLSDISLAAHEGFSWKNGDVEFTKVGENKATAIYNPDPDNYINAEVELIITVTGADVKEKVEKPDITDILFTYNESLQGPVISHNGDSNLYDITGAYSATDAGKYTFTISLKDKENYEWADGTTGDIVVNWEIKKANPSYTLPEGIEAKIGDVLSSVDLPANFSWADGSIVLNTCGYIKVMATYTPADTDNYNVITDIEITIAVAQIAEGIRFVQSKEYAYTYGDLLSKFNSLLAEEKASVAGTFSFKSAGDKPNAGTTSVKIVFTPNAGDAVEFDLRITVAKAQAVAPGTLPSGFTAKVGDKLSSISLEAYPGFSWKEAGFEFTQTGENKVWAIYNPDPNNYINVEVELTITVSEAEPDSPGLSPVVIALMSGGIGLVVLGAILMIVFISRRRRQLG